MKRLSGATTPSSAWPTASPSDGADRADGYCEPSGLRSCGPDRGEAVVGVEAGRASAAAVPGSTSASGFSTATTGAPVAAIPRFAARP